MEPLGSFPRVLNVLPREKIEGPPRDFLKANPRPYPRPDLRQKPEGPPKGAFNIRPREYIEYSRNLPRAPFSIFNMGFRKFICKFITKL